MAQCTSVVAQVRLKAVGAPFGKVESEHGVVYMVAEDRPVDIATPVRKIIQNIEYCIFIVAQGRPKATATPVRKVDTKHSVLHIYSSTS